MIYLDTKNGFPECNTEQFVNYLFNKCDKFAFCLPNFKQSGAGTKMKMNKEYRCYIEKNKEFLDEIQPYIIKHCIVKKYFNLRSSYACDSYVVTLYKGMKKRLLNKSNLCSWQYPDLPENLIFFEKKNDLCWIEVIAHEDEIRMYNETTKDLEMLRMCSTAEYDISSSSDIRCPKLSDLK